MWKNLCCLAAAVLCGAPGRAADLTETETRWLQGAWPVISFARQADIPLDVVVQPQPMPGAAPMALAFIEGRCKLVLSMRGNPEAQATLDRIEPQLLDMTLELMAAHELGHCRRYLDGAWYHLPATFRASQRPDPDAGRGDAGIDEADARTRAMRREEGYGDLVGLAWTKRHHPTQYPALRAWLLAERAKDYVAGSPHDTIAWVQRANDGHALVTPSLFAGAAEVWASELEADED